MVQPASIGDFGTGDITTYPTELLNSLFPYYNLSQLMPYQYADLQQQADKAAQDRQYNYAALQAQAAAGSQDAQARLAAAQIGAGATVQGAQIGAQAQIDAALMGARAELQGLQAQIQRDVQLAAGGDRNANNRLQANLQQTAQITNQANRLELAKMASSGGLRDSLAARMAVSGVGNMPGFGSGLLAGGLQEITAPTVNFSDYGPAPTVNMNLPSGGNYGGGGYTGGGYTGGGGGAGRVPMPNFTTPKITVPDFTPTPITMPPPPDFSKIFVPPPGGVTPAPVFHTADNPGPGPGVSIPGLTPEQIQILGSGGPLMASGGAVPPGHSFIAGDPQKRGKPNPEVVTPIPGVGTFVTPLAGKYAWGTDAVPASWSERVKQMVLAQQPTPAVQPTPEPAPLPPESQPTPDVQPTPAVQPPIPAAQPPAGGANLSPTAAQNLPSWQALIAGKPGTQKWNLGKWDVPEWGVSGVPNPYAGASTFLRMAPSQQQEIADLWGQATGNVLDWNTIMQMVNAANPGHRTGPSLRF